MRSHRATAVGPDGSHNFIRDMIFYFKILLDVDSDAKHSPPPTDVNVSDLILL